MTVIVTGATSIVGRYLLPRLVGGGFRVHALSRRAPVAGHASAGSVWHVADIGAGIESLDVQADYAIHLAPLWLLPSLVDPLFSRGVRRIIAFGSTSRFTKEASSDPRERDVAWRLAEAEKAIESACRGRIGWTIFRPTLIYGGGLDRNVTTIAAFIRRFGFFAIAGEGRGRRQPVHADDLASACLAALDCPATVGRTYNLGGGSTLTYREMVDAVFAGLGRRPRIVRFPSLVMRGLIGLAGLSPRFRHLSVEMVDRMSADLCFDSKGATRDFGYAPRPFSYPGASPASPLRTEGPASPP